LRPSGIAKEQVTPVDVVITQDGTKAYVALGRANHVAVVDVKTRTVLAYVMTGLRPWGLALNGDETRLYAANGWTNTISVIDTATNHSLVEVPVGEAPYAILVDDQ
jgi:YVTN family beta-propeller protein